MALNSKLVVASILLTVVLLLLHGVQPIQATGNSAAGTAYTPTPSIDCGVACGDRCRLSGRPNLCKRACGSCCKECSCVPPGTYGNYEACPCYAKLKTHDDKLKCP